MDPLRMAAMFSSHVGLGKEEIIWVVTARVDDVAAAARRRVDGSFIFLFRNVFVWSDMMKDKQLVMQCTEWNSEDDFTCLLVRLPFLHKSNPLIYIYTLLHSISPHPIYPVNPVSPVHYLSVFLSKPRISTKINPLKTLLCHGFLQAPLYQAIR